MEEGKSWGYEFWDVCVEEKQLPVFVRGKAFVGDGVVEGAAAGEDLM